MANFVKSRVVATQPPIGAGWPAPGPTAGGCLAIELDSVSGHSKAKLAMFVRGVGRAVAPAVDPRVAPISLKGRPTPQRSADRSFSDLPTYLRHPEVSA